MRSTDKVLNAKDKGSLAVITPCDVPIKVVILVEMSTVVVRVVVVVVVADRISIVVDLMRLSGKSPSIQASLFLFRCQGPVIE